MGAGNIWQEGEGIFGESGGREYLPRVWGENFSKRNKIVGRQSNNIYIWLASHTPPKKQKNQNQKQKTIKQCGRLAGFV